MTASIELVPEDRDNERALAHRAADGDDAAFAELYRRHSSRVFALCLRMSGSRDKAIDLTQDVFVHLWQKLGSFRGESALGSWIHRMTVNLVISNARSDQRRLTHEVRAEHSDDSDDNAPANVRVEGTVRPASVLEAVDLERAIAALPPGARTVFVLHDVEGYQHDEIAKLTGTAVGTCRAQLHRARKLLMEALGK